MGLSRGCLRVSQYGTQAPPEEVIQEESQAQARAILPCIPDSQKQLTITSATSYWSLRPVLGQQERGQEMGVKTRRWRSLGAVLGPGSFPQEAGSAGALLRVPPAGRKELGYLPTPHSAWVMAPSGPLFFCLSPARRPGEAAETMGPGAHQGANPHSALN